MPIWARVASKRNPKVAYSRGYGHRYVSPKMARGVWISFALVIAGAIYAGFHGPF